MERLALKIALACLLLALLILASAAWAQEKAAADRFDIEGIALGMTGDEIAAILDESGWYSNVELANDATQSYYDNTVSPPDGFWKDPNRAPGTPEIRIRYRAGGARAQWIATEITYTLTPGGDEDQSPVGEAALNSYVRRFGEPDACRADLLRGDHDDCVWTHRKNGAQETLHWRFAVSGAPLIKLQEGTVPGSPVRTTRIDGWYSVYRRRTYCGRLAAFGFRPLRFPP